LLNRKAWFPGLLVLYETCRGIWKLLGHLSTFDFIVSKGLAFAKVMFECLKANDWILILIGFAWIGYILLRGDPNQGIEPIVGVGRPVISQSPPTGKFSTMGFRWMRDECNKLHSEYSSLWGTVPEQTNKPLDKNSWPWETKKEWSTAELRLYRLEYSFQVFKELTQREWSNMGWNNDLPKILAVPASLTMTDLLAALEQHRDLLNQRIASVMQTKNAM
jgi:hypothetical protein